MAESCALSAPVARKNQSTILQRLASVGQRPVADAIGVSEATVSRMKSEHLESFSALLAALGLKVVPAEHKCYPVDYIEHLRFFASMGIKQEESSVRLTWEEGE